MSGELFKAMAQINMLHVPYRGIAAGGLSDLMTGVVHVAFDNLPSSLEPAFGPASCERWQ